MYTKYLLGNPEYLQDGKCIWKIQIDNLKSHYKQLEGSRIDAIFNTGFAKRHWEKAKYIVLVNKQQNLGLEQFYRKVGWNVIYLHIHFMF